MEKSYGGVIWMSSPRQHPLRISLLAGMPTGPQPACDTTLPARTPEDAPAPSEDLSLGRKAAPPCTMLHGSGKLTL